MNRIRKNRATKLLTIGYVRVSTDEQVIMNQKLEILEYCRIHKLNIDKWFESKVSPHNRSSDYKRIGELLSLSEGGILVSTEISGLGRSTSEVLKIVNQILKNGTRVVFTKQNLDLGIVDGSVTTRTTLAIFSALAELERGIISLRIRESFSTRKKQGASVGKARGTIQDSIYDTKKEQILLLLSKKISVLDISRIIGIGRPRSLLIYLNRRKLREERKTRK